MLTKVACSKPQSLCEPIHSESSLPIFNSSFPAIKGVEWSFNRPIHKAASGASAKEKSARRRWFDACNYRGKKCDQSIDQSYNHTINRSIEQPTEQPTNQLTNQSINQTMEWPINQANDGRKMQQCFNLFVRRQKITHLICCKHQLLIRLSAAGWTQYSVTDKAETGGTSWGLTVDADATADGRFHALRRESDARRLGRAQTGAHGDGLFEAVVASAYGVVPVNVHLDSLCGAVNADYATAASTVMFPIELQEEKKKIEKLGKTLKLLFIDNQLHAHIRFKNQSKKQKETNETQLWNK